MRISIYKQTDKSIKVVFMLSNFFFLLYISLGILHWFHIVKELFAWLAISPCIQISEWSIEVGRNSQICSAIRKVSNEIYVN